jgi:hypothetical protein
LHKALTILFCLNLVLAQAQSLEPKGSVQFNVGLPINLGNEAFKGIMQGLVNGSFHYQYTLKNSISFGIGANYTYFDVNEFKVSEPLFGGMHTPAVFLKLGSEKFHTSTFGTDISVKAGIAQTVINTSANKENGVNSVLIQSSYIEPMLGLIMLSDEKFGLRFNFSYGIYGFGFTPYQLGLNSHEGFNPKEFSKVTSFFSFGFAYTHYFRMH